MVLPVILPSPDTDFDEENLENKPSDDFDTTSRHLHHNNKSTDQTPDSLVANDLEINFSDDLQTLEHDNKTKLCKEHTSENNKADNLGSGKFTTNHSNKRKLLDDADAKTVNSNKRMKQQLQNSDQNFLDFHVMSDLKNKQQGCWKSSLPNTSINDVYSFESDESADKEENSVSKSLDKTVLHKRQTNAAGGIYDKPTIKTSCTYTEKQPKDSRYLIVSPLHFDSEVTTGKHLEIKLEVSENKVGMIKDKTLALGGFEKPTNVVGEDLVKHSARINEFDEASNKKRTSKNVMNLEQPNTKHSNKISKTSEGDRKAINRNKSEPFEPWKDMRGGSEYCQQMASNLSFKDQYDINQGNDKANKIPQNLKTVEDLNNRIGTPSNATCKIKGCLCATAVSNLFKNNDLPILQYNPVLFQPPLNSLSLIDSNKLPNRTGMDGLCETGWYRPRQSVIDRRLEAIRKVSLWIGDCLDQNPEDKVEPLKLNVPSKGPSEERRKLSKLTSKNVKSKCAVSDQIKCAVSKTLSKNKCAVNTKQNCIPDECNLGDKGKESTAAMIGNRVVGESVKVSGKDTRKEKVTDQPGLLQNTNNTQRNDNKFEYPVEVNNSLPARNVKDVFAFQSNEELDAFAGVREDHCSRTHLFTSFKKANKNSEDVTKLKCAFNDKHSVSSILQKENSSKIGKFSHSIGLEITKEHLCILDSEKVRKTEEKRNELQNNSFAESKEVLQQKLVLNVEQTDDRSDNILDLTVGDSNEQNKHKHRDKMFVDRDSKYIHSGAEFGEIGNCVNTDKTVKGFNLVSDVKSSNSELLTKDFVKDFKINIVSAVEHEVIKQRDDADHSLELGTNSNKESGIKFDSNKETTYTYKSPFIKSNNTMQADEIDDAEETNSLNLNLEDFNQAYKESIETVQSLRDIDTLADNDNIIGNVIIQETSCKVSHGFRPDVVSTNSSQESATKEMDQIKVNTTITRKIKKLGTGSVDKNYMQKIIIEDIEGETKDIAKDITTNTGEVSDLGDMKQQIENPDRIKMDSKRAVNFSYDLALQECELESENYPDMMNMDESGQKLLENFADIEPSLGISDQNSTVVDTQDPLTSFQIDSLRELKFLNDLNPILDSSSKNSNMYKPIQHGFNVIKGGNSVSLSDPNSVSDDLVSMNSNSEANSFTLDDALVSENTGEDYQWNNMLKSFILQNLENEPNSENKPNGTKMTESSSVDVELLLEQKLAEQYLNRNIESLKRKHSEDF